MKSFTVLAFALFAVTPALAQTMTGTLADGDPTRGGGELYEQHTFEVSGAQKVTVRMESTAFDTYLVLRSPSGQESSNDDFEGSQDVSQIESWASETGKWTVLASQYSSGAGGAYSLTIEKGAPATVEIVQGRLDYADETALKGEYFDMHSFDLSATDELIVELLSLGFDGYLVVTSPDGEVWRNDDAGSTDLSRVGPVRGAGKYRVDVTSNSAGEAGAYDLRFIVAPKGQ